MKRRGKYGDKFLECVIYPDTVGWVAQCLQVNIAAHGKTINTAVKNLEKTIKNRIRVCEKEGIDPFNLTPAPKETWALFKMSESIER